MSQVVNYIGWCLIFSLISVILVSGVIMNYAIMNDYYLQEIYDLTEDYVASGELTSASMTIAEDINAGMVKNIVAMDNLWFLLFIIFNLSLAYYSYFTERLNLFGFTGMLYVGLMFSLFILGIYLNISEWYYENILLQLVPTVSTILPKFTFFLNNAGVIVLIQSVTALVLNVIDLDFSKFTKQKEKEQDLATEEVL